MDVFFDNIGPYISELYRRLFEYFFFYFSIYIFVLKKQKIAF